MTPHEGSPSTLTQAALGPGAHPRFCAEPCNRSHLHRRISGNNQARLSADRKPQLHGHHDRRRTLGARGRPPRLSPSCARAAPWWTDSVAVVVWATCLVVVMLWVSNGGAADLAAGAGPASASLGRLTGLISSDLLLLQVLTMARFRGSRAPSAKTRSPGGTGSWASPRST